MTMPTRQLIDDHGFYARTRCEAEELRRLAASRPNLPLDLALIPDHLEDLGTSERDAVFSLTDRIIGHLLPIACWPARHLVNHGLDEVEEFREQIGRKITPTIEELLQGELDGVWGRGRCRVERKVRRYGEDGHAAKPPARPGFTLDQLLAGPDC